MKPLQMVFCLSLLVAAPAVAQTIPPQDLEAFLARISDIEATLSLERDAHAAVLRKDKKWFAEQDAIVSRNDLPIMKSMLDKKNTLTSDLAFRMGPCHYAGLMIRTIIRVGAENTRKGRPLSKATQSTGPDDKTTIADDFAEHMGRCERIKRLPRSKRLIGQTIE